MFGKQPVAALLIEKNKPGKMIRFLQYDQGTEQNSQELNNQLDQVMCALGRVDAKELLPRVKKVKMRTTSPLQAWRLAILAANAGEVRLYQKAFYSESIDVQAKVKDCARIQALYASEPAQLMIIDWLGSQLSPDNETQALAAAKYLQELYNATNQSGVHKRIMAFDERAERLARSHTDTHDDSNYSEETAYNGWFCDHSDSHTDEHTDIPAIYPVYLHPPQA